MNLFLVTSFANQLLEGIDEIKKHIILVDNYPVVDKAWLMSVFQKEIDRVFSRKKYSFFNTLKESFRIIENIRKTILNLRTQKKLKDFLDKIDSKLEEMNQKIRNLADESMRLSVSKTTIGQLLDELVQIEWDYDLELGNTFGNRIFKFIRS